MSTPNTTTAQITVFVSVLAIVLSVVFKFDLTDAQRAALVIAIGTVYSIAHLIADAIIRHGRAKVAAARIAADSQPIVAHPHDSSVATDA